MLQNLTMNNQFALLPESYQETGSFFLLREAQKIWDYRLLRKPADGEEGTWRISKTSLDCDPAWGKWLALRDAKVEALAYDQQHQELRVPARCWLPMPFGKAAALCSGYAPSIIPLPEACTGLDKSARKFLIYRDIPPVIARGIAKKLGQTLRSTTVN